MANIAQISPRGSARKIVRSKRHAARPPRPRFPHAADERQTGGHQRAGPKCCALGPAGATLTVLSRSGPLTRPSRRSLVPLRAPLAGVLSRSGPLRGPHAARLCHFGHRSLASPVPVDQPRWSVPGTARWSVIRSRTRNNSTDEAACKQHIGQMMAPGVKPYSWQSSMCERWPADTIRHRAPRSAPSGCSRAERPSRTCRLL